MLWGTVSSRPRATSSAVDDCGARCADIGGDFLTSRKRRARYRLLAAAQAFIVVGSMLAPLSVVAKEPSGDPAALQPAPQASSSPSPAADSAVDVTPTPAPAAPTPAPTDEPAPTPTPSSPSQAPPAEPSVQPMATPSPAPSVAPSVTPSVAPPAEATPPAAEATPPAAEAASPSPEASASGDTSDFVVTFAPGTDAVARASILSGVGADVVDSIAPLRMAVVRVAAGSSVLDALRAHDEVSRIEPDRERASGARPSDPGYRAQWSLPLIGWDKVYGTVRPSGSAIVAVLDTGVDASQPDLAGQLVAGTGVLPGSDPTHDPNGHGTEMAGIIAAATNNHRGIAGIGYAGVKVMPVTVLDANGLGQDSDIIEGIVWAVDHGADVINLSFSNPGYSTALQAAIDYAWDHDVVVVAATGNDGSGIPTYPAGDHGVIGVSDTDRSDRLDASSNYGADTFLGAPGTDIRTLRAGGGTTTITGTSASSAEVAAAAALLRAIDPRSLQRRHRRPPGALRRRRRNARRDRQRPPRPSPCRRRSGDRADHARRSSAVRERRSVRRPVRHRCGDGQRDLDPQRIGRQHQRRARGVDHARDDRDDDRCRSRRRLGLLALGLRDGRTRGGGHDMRRSPEPRRPGTFSETMTITAPAAAGTYNLYLYAYNGDACASGQSALFTRANALDNVVPTVTINQAAAQLDPTNGATINFTVVFSETVIGFATGDVTLSGTAGATTGTVTGGPTTYNVAVTGMTGSGTVIATIGAGVAADAAGNPNDPSTSTDNTVTRDVTPPTVTIDQAVGQADPTATTPILFTVVFSEPVTGFITGDVAVGGTSGGAKTGTVSGGPTVYTVTVTGMTTSGTVVATIAANKANDLVRQRQHRLHLDRQHGHLGRDRADRDHQPGGRPARPDEHEPDPLHGRLQ